MLDVRYGGLDLLFSENLQNLKVSREFKIIVRRYAVFNFVDAPMRNRRNA